MLAVTGAFPGIPAVVACILNTGLTAIDGSGVAGVGLIRTFGADLEFFMRMVCFGFCFVIVAATAVGGAGIIGRAEVVVADLSSADHNTCAVISAVAGVALNGVEIFAFCVINKTHMREIGFEEKIALNGGVGTAAFIRQTEIAGVCNTGAS